MSVIKKLVTLLRGSARELGQSMVDANATRIYEQEITDAKASIGQAKTELTGVMAQQMQTAREIERIKADVLRHENMALQALDKQKDDLALEVAARVAALEAELQAQTEAHAAYALQVSRLKDLIRSAEARVREHEREIGIAKTTESVYRADRMAAAEELDAEFGHRALERKLAEAGIGEDPKVKAQDVMARLRARRASLALPAPGAGGPADAGASAA